MAAHLGNYLKQQAPDLVLTGIQSGYADTGLVGPRLATHLSLPFLDDITQIGLSGHNLHLCQTTQQGTRNLTARLPLCLSVGNSSVTALRPSTLRAQLEAGKRSETLLTLEADEKLCPPALSRPIPGQGAQMLQTDSPHQSAQVLLELVAQEGSP